MNRWWEAAQIALLDLRLNPVRSLLSLAGVVIGIASVVAVISVGAGAREIIQAKFEDLGLYEYSVSPVFDRASRRQGELGPVQLDRLRALPFVEAVLPETNLYMLALRSPHADARGAVLGIDKETLGARRLHVPRGRALLPLELEGLRQACLISERLASELYPAADAVGRTVWAEEVPWRIIGVYSPEKSSRMGHAPDGRALLVPFRALLRAYPKAEVQRAMLRVKPGHEDAAPRLIEQALGNPERGDLYRVFRPTRLIERRTQAVRLMTVVGAVIAAISLLVGEIGVMNVLLTSVAERTREIGLRRALGARKADILGQFLVESSLLSFLGGLLGLLGGILLAHLLSPAVGRQIQEELPVHLPPGLLWTSVGSAALLGALFGLYPASKAARLDPAEALRME